MLKGLPFFPPFFLFCSFPRFVPSATSSCTTTVPTPDHQDPELLLHSAAQILTVVIHVSPLGQRGLARHTTDPAATRALSRPLTAPTPPRSSSRAIPATR